MCEAKIGEWFPVGVAHLLIFAEIGNVCFRKLFGPIGNGLELACEEAECLGLVNETETADEMTVIVEPLDTVDDVFCLRERENTAREGETNHFN